MTLVLDLPLDVGAVASDSGHVLCPPALVRAALGVLARGGGRTRMGGWQAGVVLVDGRSGSGKTSIARRLARALTASGIRGLQVAHLDSWYQGWSGLESGTRITETLLGSRRSGEPVGYPTWDWARGRVSGFVALDPDRPLIIEGVGSLTRSSARGADLRIWLEVGVGLEIGGEGRAAEAAVRKHRALDRDGDGFRPWWDMWAEQEEVHLREHDPRALADLVLRT